MLYISQCGIQLLQSVCWFVSLKRAGYKATPLFLAVLTLMIIDAVFAVDSVTAKVCPHPSPPPSLGPDSLRAQDLERSEDFEGLVMIWKDLAVFFLICGDLQGFVRIKYFERFGRICKYLEGFGSIWI